MRLISDRKRGVSPNHTTPGRAREPHSGQCGRSFSGIAIDSFSSDPLISSNWSEAFPRAGHKGDEKSSVDQVQSEDVHRTSNIFPCISNRELGGHL